MRRTAPDTVAGAETGGGQERSREGCQRLAPVAFQVGAAGQIANRPDFQVWAQVIDMPADSPIPRQVAAQACAQATRAAGTAQVNVFAGREIKPPQPADDNS